MKSNQYRWQAPGNGKIFDAPLGEESYMNSRTISVLKYISINKQVTQSQFEREIKEYLQKHTQYRENNSTPAHFFRPLLFLGFIRMSSSKMIDLTLEGEKFLFYYEAADYKQCKKFILNQLDNTKYPNIGTKNIKLQLFPFRILFKILLNEGVKGLNKSFIKEQMIYIREYSDIVLYEQDGNIEKIKRFEEYDKFYTWVINALVDIDILKREEEHYFIADDVYSHVKDLYQDIKFESYFFNDDTIFCQLDSKTARERYKRDATFIVNAKQRDNHTCQINSQHHTFISKGQNYVEGHHIVPMFQQKNYTFSLDNIDNIISLCPTCHREIHSADDKKYILEKLYNLSESFMKSHQIKLNDLFKMYYCA